MLARTGPGLITTAMNHIMSTKLNINFRLFSGNIAPLIAITALLFSAGPTGLNADSGTYEGSDKEHESKARTIELTGNDMMKYDITEIEATAGETIILSLKNIGTIPKAGMAHNFVLLKNGVDAQAFSMAAMMSGATGYIPEDRKDEIIAYTGMAGPGETVKIEFTVPEEPGTYVFVCTFPGHYLAGMKGVLTVKAS